METLSPQHVRVEILVEEGPPTLEPQGRHRRSSRAPLQTSPAAVPSVADRQRAAGAGGRFDEEAYKASKDALKRALTDRGYAYAKVTSSATIDLGARAADYLFKVEPGPLAKFGAITIVGLDPDGSTGPRPQEIDEAPLRRAMNITEGETFSTADLDAATQALLDLEVFSAVQIVPDLPEPPPEHPVVPLKVSVEPTKLRQLRLGIGAELDEIKTDVHLIVGWEDHNFLGGLRDLSIDFRPGVVLYPLRIGTLQAPNQPLLEERLKVQFRQPSFLEARTSGFLKPEINTYPFLVQPNPSSSAPVVGYVEGKGALGVDRPFGKLFVSLAYNAQLEHPFYYVQLPATDPLPPEIVLAYPQLITKLDLRDDPTHPHKGVYLANDLQIASGALGSNAHDVRIQPEVRGYIPLAKHVTLAARGSVGFLFPSNYQVAKYLPDEFAGPTVHRVRGARRGSRRTLQIEETYFRGFFSGGPSTNRGFPLRGIAPYGFVPFLLPQTASSQVANGCVPGAPERLAAAVRAPDRGASRSGSSRSRLASRSPARSRRRSSATSATSRRTRPTCASSTSTPRAASARATTPRWDPSGSTWATASTGSRSSASRTSSPRRGRTPRTARRRSSSPTFRSRSRSASERRTEMAARRCARLGVRRATALARSR